MNSTERELKDKNWMRWDTIICIISAFYAFLASGNTPMGDNGVLLLFFLSSFALPNTVSHRGSFHCSQWRKVSWSLAGAILEFAMYAVPDWPWSGSLSSPPSDCLSACSSQSAWQFTEFSVYIAHRVHPYPWPACSSLTLDIQHLSESA